MCTYLRGIRYQGQGQVIKPHNMKCSYLSLLLIYTSSWHVLMFPENSNPNVSQTINGPPACLQLIKSPSNAGDVNEYEPVDPSSRQVTNVHDSEANLPRNKGDICENEDDIYSTLFEGHIYANKDNIWCMLLFFISMSNLITSDGQTNLDVIYSANFDLCVTEHFYWRFIFLPLTFQEQYIVLHYTYIGFK